MTPLLAVLGEMYKVKQICNELINQQYLEVGLLILLLQNLHHLGPRELVEPERPVVVQITDGFMVELPPRSHPLQQLPDYRVMRPHHRPDVDVPVHLVGKDGEGRGVAVQQTQGTDEVALPLRVTVPNHHQQLGEVVTIHAVVLKHAGHQEHQTHPIFLEVVERAVEMKHAVPDLLRQGEHRVDVQREAAEAIVDVLDC